MRMTANPTTESREPALRRYLFLAAALLQLGCGLIFTFDALAEIREFTVHSIVEILGILALAIGAVITLGQYRMLVRRNIKVERELDAASGAFQDVIEKHFVAWQLTEAEQDVALLSIKGVSIADIATMRRTRMGTIRAQSAAIYRKSGVSNRAELISVMIEDMIAGVDLTKQKSSKDLPSAG